MGIEESDIEKIADVVNKKRKPYRWYNDAEKAKKVGPIIETLCYVFGFGLFIVGFFVITAASFDIPVFGIHNPSDTFIDSAIASMDCESLKRTSISFLHSEKQTRLSNNLVQADLNAELLARC